MLRDATGSWLPIFVVAIAFDWIGALLALFVLKPMRARWVTRPGHAVDAPPVVPAPAAIP